ncbi:MAG: phosphoribosylformylglycinamidine synthase subunit PurS [Crocinitomicaceae bacterium]|jgi:phosphoribosylformylglycinamidine synthase PurS subunit|nr:phosphoribosylformylglycinamidine synthase subunit PurS [Cryomorphaceae bacterium]MCF8268740.1 phosphoribosylformylglycinamidine synthase subunit PurS [Crocinitomicaceae bacterium]
MKFKAEIDVMPHDALLDPQGKAVTHAMASIGMHEIQGVRIGRHIRLFVDSESIETAKERVEEACKNMLANAIMESYTYTVEAV